MRIFPHILVLFVVALVFATMVALCMGPMQSQWVTMAPFQRAALEGDGGRMMGSLLAIIVVVVAGTAREIFD